MKDRYKKSLTWGKRLSIVIVLLFGMMYGMLSLAQNSSESLRKGLEDFLIQETGHRAEVTDLHEPRLVPDISFDVRGIYIRDKSDSNKVYFHADSAHVVMPFWRILVGSGAYYKLELKGAEIATGYFLPQKLNVDFAGISDPTPGKAPAQLIIEGNYNKHPLLVTMEMDRKEKSKGPLYSLGNTTFTTFKLGPMEGDGMMKRGLMDVTLDSARLRREGVEATFTAEGIGKKPLDIKIQGQVGGVDFNAALTRKEDTVVLTLTPRGASAEGIEAVKSFADTVIGDLGLKGKEDVLRVDFKADIPQETKIPKDSKE